MRKLLFVFCLFLVSCTTIEEDDFFIEDYQRMDESSLISQLQDYTTSLPTYTPTRGALRIFASASADVLAVPTAFKSCVWTAAFTLALSGGTATPVVAAAVLAGTGLLSAGASYVAYRSCSISAPMDDFLTNSYNNPRVKDVMRNFYIHISDTIPVTNGLCIGIDDSAMVAVGRLHNDLLDAVLSEPDSCIHSLENIVGGSFVNNYLEPIDDLEPILEDSLNSYGLVFYDDSQIEDMMELVNGDLIPMLIGNNYNTVLENFVDEGYISQSASSVLSIFLSAVNNSVQDEDDLYDVIDYFYGMVMQSNDLSEEDKQILLLSFEVMKNSYVYWCDKDGFEIEEIPE